MLSDLQTSMETLLMVPLKDDPDFKALSERVTGIANTNISLAHKLEENTKTTEQIKEDTTEIISAFNSAKGAFEVLDWAGKVSKVLLPIILAIAGMGVAFSSGWSAVKKTLGFL